MKKRYEKEYHEKKHNYLYDNEDYYLARARVAKEQYFKGIIKIGERILEYGCGLGQNIYLLHNPIGYDISSFALNFCKKKGIHVTNRIKELKNKGFDVVLCCEVLEHIEEPLKTLKVIHSKLKKGGKLILILPIEKKKRPEFFDYNQHFYSWNSQSITNLLMRAGFYPINYKIMRRTGFRKFLFLYKANLFRPYLFFTWLTAIISGSKHRRIISVKK